MPAVLIATLGAEPQVISLATQLLLQQEALTATVVLHTQADYPPVDQALPSLQTFFAAQPNWANAWNRFHIGIAEVCRP